MSFFNFENNYYLDGINCYGQLKNDSLENNLSLVSSLRENGMGVVIVFKRN